MSLTLVRRFLVPAYIAFAREGNYAAAVGVIRQDNPFPTACAFVCENPCETYCRRSLIDSPLNIRGIKRFIVDQVAEVVSNWNKYASEVEVKEVHKEQIGKNLRTGL